MSLINVSNLTFSYEGSYDNIFENVSFQIDTDWKLGFIGRNGRGKTTFLNLMLGKYAYSGNISSTVKFEYFPYDVEDKSLYTIEVMKSICTECMDWEIFVKYHCLMFKKMLYIVRLIHCQMVSKRRSFLQLYSLQRVVSCLLMNLQTILTSMHVM